MFDTRSSTRLDGDSHMVHQDKDSNGRTPVSFTCTQTFEPFGIESHRCKETGRLDMAESQAEGVH